MKRKFNEDTRVKIPATLQFLRIGYNYQSIRGFLESLFNFNKAERKLYQDTKKENPSV